MKSGTGLLLGLLLIVAVAACGPAEETPFVPPSLTELEPLVARVLQEGWAEVEADPTQGESWGRLGGAYLAHGLLPAAESCFRRATVREPDRFDWRYLLAVVEQERGASFDELTSMYADAAELRKDYVPLHLRWGQAAMAAERVSDASAAFTRARDLDPESAPAHRGLGQAALIDQQYALAHESLMKAAALEPLDGAVAADLARLFAAQGEDDKARAAAERARALRPVARVDDPVMAQRVHAMGASARHWFARAKEAVARGAWSTAEEHLRAVESTRADDPDVIFLRATIDQGQGDNVAVLDAVERTLAVQPEHVAALMMRAQIAIGRGDVEAGLVDLQLARSVVPDSHEVLSAMAATLLRMDRRDEAIEIYQKVAQLLPANASVWFNLGQLQAGAGRTVEARKAFRRTLELNPDHAPAASRLALLEGGDGSGASRRN